jgi:hypothetical protein
VLLLARRRARRNVAADRQLSRDLRARRRPWRLFARLDSDRRRLLLAWGEVLAAMIACFSLAIDRLSLATVATIEFPPVVALAADGVRGARNDAALLAIGGVCCAAWPRHSPVPEAKRRLTRRRRRGTRQPGAADLDDAVRVDPDQAHDEGRNPRAPPPRPASAGLRITRSGRSSRRVAR